MKLKCLACAKQIVPERSVTVSRHYALLKLSRFKINLIVKIKQKLLEKLRMRNNLGVIPLSCYNLFIEQTTVYCCFPFLVFLSPVLGTGLLAFASLFEAFASFLGAFTPFSLFLGAAAFFAGGPCFF